MKLSHFRIVFALIVGGAVAFAVYVAQATSKEDIVFPVTELGGCADENTCRRHCDEPENFQACFKFARKHNLLEGPVANVKEEDIDRFAEALEDGGPGGCRTQQECENFCNDAANMLTCMRFADEHNLVPEEERDEFRKVKAAVERGVMPPCANKDSCEQICENPSTIEQAEACFRFAAEAGLLPPDVPREQVEKMFQAMRDGKIPFRNPRDFEKCENPEENPEIIDTCIQLGIEMGMMKPEEAEMAKLMMREGGPGGCRGRECKDFCENNQEECMKFFEEKGIPIPMPPEAQAQMQEGLTRMREALAQAPPEVAECLKAEIGDEVYDGIQSGTVKVSQMARLGPKMGEVMQGCFEKAFGGGPGFGPPGEGGPGFGPPGEGGGPGGASPEMMKCFKKEGWDMRSGPPSQEIIQECAGEFGPPGGMLPPDAPRLFGPDEDHPEGPNGEFGPPGGIPEGMMPEGFEGEGMEGQFPGGPPTPEQMQRMQEEGFDQQFKGQYPQQYQQQYEQERQRIEEQMRGQYGAPPGYEGGPPPGYEGGFPGGDGQYGPPPGDYQQPPPDGGSGEPQSSRSFLRLLGNAILNLFGVRTR